MEASTKKKCKDCQESKPISSFYLVGKPRTPSSVCRDCEHSRRRTRYRLSTRDKVLKNNSEWYKRNKASIVFYRVRKKYGITREQYEGMLHAQGGLCAICECVLATPNIDHDHETGRIRGMLCSNCNRAIGLLKDDPDILESAADYLRS